MSKPIIHFAYTVPGSSHFWRRALDRFIRLVHLQPLHRGGHELLIPWQRPIRAPHSISYNLLHALKERGAVRFYSLFERTVARLGAGDIFIGQPAPLGGFSSSGSSTDDPLSVTSRTIRKYSGRRTFLIMPYNHDPLYVSWARGLLSQPIEGLILVGGDIWQRDWDEKSPFRDLPIKRRINVNMGIEPDDYPLVKKSFNPVGQRKYLYIGHTSWSKNTRELENIARAIPNFQGGHIGGGTIKGWKKLADFVALTPQFMSKIAEEYDIFVNVSTADAQATTILEQMCFGLVVACTPESGYDHPSLIKLSTTDTNYNVSALQKLQQAPEVELLSLSRQNRLIAETEHSWEKFCTTVINFVGLG
ncbi:MAG: hypothetical protein AAB364_02370 [Patescibacteria group bacterium]